MVYAPVSVLMRYMARFYLKERCYNSQTDALRTLKECLRWCPEVDFPGILCLAAKILPCVYVRDERWHRDGIAKRTPDLDDGNQDSMYTGSRCLEPQFAPHERDTQSRLCPEMGCIISVHFGVFLLL